MHAHICQKVSMTRKHHNHTLQTNPQYCEEEPQKRYLEDKAKQQALFLIKMIQKLERTLSNA